MSQASATNDRPGRSDAPLVWITGASSGIGAALARRFCARGQRVILSARSGKALAQQALALGRSAHPLPLDVSNRKSVAAAWRYITATWGVPDQIVLNAGAWRADAARDIRPDELQRLLSVNLMGVVNAMDLAAPAMMDRGSGEIVVVASVAGFSGLPGAAAYCASKAALQAWCEAMQPELAAAGVFLMVANPGFVDTPMTRVNDFPMPFMITADDAADAILKGLGRRAPSFAFPLTMGLCMRALSVLPTRLRLAIKRQMLRQASV